VSHADHIHSPDAVALGASGSDRGLALRFQLRNPAQQSWRVMGAEVFPIYRFQPGTGNFVQHARNVRHFTTGKHEAVDKFAAGRPAGLVVPVTGADPVIEDDATRLQQSRDCAEIKRQVGDADMLIHADRDDFVEDCLSGNVAVILAAYLDSAGQPGGSDSPPSLVDLRLAEGDTDGGDAVARRCPADQPTPATANVEQPIAGLELQLAADMVELLFLCSVKILLAGPKVNAGIDHVPVEP